MKSFRDYDRAIEKLENEQAQLGRELGRAVVLLDHLDPDHEAYEYSLAEADVERIQRRIKSVDDKIAALLEYV